MGYKNDNQLFWRVRVARSIQKRIQIYLIQHPTIRIIPLLNKIISDWLKDKNY